MVKELNQTPLGRLRTHQPSDAEVVGEQRPTGLATLQEKRVDDNGRSVRIDKPKKRVDRFKAKDLDPPLEETYRPLANIVIDWFAIRGINVINACRGFAIAVLSFYRVARFGWCSHEVTVLRSLWCFAGDKGKPCTHLVYDETTKDYYCGGANKGTGCGCGQTLLSRIMSIVRRNGASCPMKYWGRGENVTNPLTLVQLEVEETS